MIDDLFPNPVMNPIEEKGKKSWVVTVDLDMWYEYFLRPRNEVPGDEREGISLEVIRSKIRELETRLNRHLTVHYRRSSRGHAHIRIDFGEPITIFSCFLIRSVLYDDMMRQNLDQSRFALRNSLETMNKCFDYKIDSGKIHSSGPWIPLNKGRDDLAGAAKEDWDRYWESIGKQYHKGENHRALILSHFKELTDKQQEKVIHDLVTLLVKERATPEQMALAV